jgi:hydrogenase maturation protein HypF
MLQGAAVRRAILVRGTVQGVGFRPTVYRLACAHRLAGFVRNDAAGVWIEVEGEGEEVDRFPAVLRDAAPPLSRIESMEVVALPPRGERRFRVAESCAGGGARAAIPADAATCDACLRELFDQDDRRYRYPFVNCTDCGPRYTIVRDGPYDRARTTMARFTLCAACREEYEDPASRRFHAEPNACPACGPRLAILGRGAAAPGEEALAAASAALARGEIVAVKGLGGFFLAVNARDEPAVARLRARKGRPDKPLALMARDLGEARRAAEVDDQAAALLRSRASPIALLPARAGADVAPSVAPRLRELGVMLPYTPLHHLLLADGPPLLVMTSGNRSGEPIARDDAEARERLGGVADLILTHDREIHSRADDSVFRAARGGPRPLRRARGLVPDAVALPGAGPPVLAVGAELKAAVCLARDGVAYLSPHLGDLSHPAAYRYFEEVIEKLSRLLGVKPRAVAHDLHPDYRGTRWALESGLPRVPVQHHHAHVAACLAESGRAGPAIGVAFDGTGCGPAGEAWGGEVLRADLAGFRRLAHLRAVALPGGEAAIRQPWRVAAAALLDAGEPLDLLGRIPPRRLAAVARLVEAGVASPRATGAGRWFDAVAALCGLRDEIAYEGQAAVELEAAAAPGPAEPYPWSNAPGGEGVEEIDLRPAVRAIAADVRRGAGASSVAARFHETLARIVAAACRRAREVEGLACVALSGGCFQNRLLEERAALLLEADGFEVLVHRKVPPNDGGLALGQAAVASHRLAARG